MQSAAAPRGNNASPKPFQSLARGISSFRAVLVATIVAKVFWTHRSNIGDPDIWWHLKNAEYMVTHRAFPSLDTYSFTARGEPWLAHEWLSELLSYVAYRAGGWQGLFILFASAFSLLFVGVFSLCRKENDDPLVAVLATLGGMLLAMVGFGPRMQTFGWLCFLGIFAILNEFRYRRNARWLWLIPVLFCLWINCHAGWLLGLAVLGLVIIAGLVPKDLGTLAAAPWSRSELRRLLIAAGGSCAALFLNPFGYRLVLYPLDALFLQRINLEHVDEWQAVNFHDSRGTYVLAALACVFLAALLSRRRWRIDDTLLVMLALYCGLEHIRLLMLTGIVLPPLLVGQIPRISSHDPARERHALNAVLLAVALVVVVVSFPTDGFVKAAHSQQFPAVAVAHLRAHPQPGRIFNWYEWGGYLEWAAPEIPTFIDPRADIFERRGVLRDYWNAATIQEPQEVLDRYCIAYALIPSQSSLAYHLRHTGWRELYTDNLSVVLKRAAAPACSTTSGITR